MVVPVTVGAASRLVSSVASEAALREAVAHVTRTYQQPALIEPFLPAQRSVSRRSLVNGVLYVLTTGCQWRQLPKDFPPRSTTHDYYVEINCTGVLTRIHHALYAKLRQLEGRAATPTLAIVDSQSVKGAEKGGRGLIRSDMTQARKLKEKSVTRLSIRSGF